MAPEGEGRLPLVEILETAPDAVVAIDASGTIVFVNRQVGELFGYDPDVLVGQPVEVLLPDRFRPLHRTHRSRYFAEPVTRPMGAGLELAGRRRDGSEFPVDISLSTVNTASGVVATAFVRDISERRRTEAMFRGLLDGAADAIVVIDRAGMITMVNRQVHTMFGYAAEELVGRPVELLVPERLREVHPRHRAAYVADPRIRAMGAGLELTARRKDGTEFPVDIALAPFDTGSGTLVSAAIRDVTERTVAEHAAQQLREAQIRRRQALEINDNVVQGVATAVYALERSDVGYALSALGITLESARLMMDRLLERPDGLDDGVGPDLVREQPATVLADTAPAATSMPVPDDAAAGVHDLITVVIADDTPDLRLVLRLALTEERGFRVVAEATDGGAVVALAALHQPDVVVVDLAMPVMDGLQAIPLIRRASPPSRVVVLSGYGAEDMLAAALEAGAAAYVTKGRPIESLVTLLRDLCPERTPTVTAVTDPLPPDLDEEQRATLDVALSVTAHELATPVTVLHGMLSTLRERMDTLPSGVVTELLDAMDRHVTHVTQLLSVLNDVRTIGRDGLVLDRVPLELGEFVAEVVRDLKPILGDRDVAIESVPVLVHADPVRLRQVLTNLLTNAAKYSEPAAPVGVAVTRAGGMVQVSVSDQGHGIPPPRQARLFVAFSRGTGPGLSGGHGGAAGHVGGMGLGLFIARGIVRAHGGELRLVHSSPRGSTFAFDVPVAVVADAAS